MKFDEFGFDPRLLEGIEAIGYQAATPIQEKAIPFIMQGRDIIGSAQTGTGKTAAFLLPIIHKIITSEHHDHIKAMIIVPTRELATQIDQQMEGFSYFTPVSSIAVYGGTDGISFGNEKQSLTEGVDVVICTPGRMIAHLNQGYTDLSHLTHLVLDEADRMLDMGFYDDIMQIISYMPKNRQNLMFSATMPGQIRQLAQKILHEPEEVSIALAKPSEKVLQLAYVIYRSQKVPLVLHLLASEKLGSVLVFCSTKMSAKQLCRELKQKGIKAEDIHSDLDQKKREEVLLDFRNRKINVLVATDILSRGIDVEDIDMVINYDVPNDGEDYIHRIGRTARAEADGIAITLISPEEQQKFSEIEKLLGEEVHKSIVPQVFGECPEYDPKKNKPKPQFGRKPSGNQRRRGRRP
ncbi:MAG TPA: DEAD/DEAH box helicase [Bacteroidales bacterium]|nr:DEAD/DEAH box helicase [Bacteroidales bacterium]HQN16411.1 DEAD/DEAH box helicase [Bacteroidales bacterium]HQP15228.1 DEAD/DEAH box helicase [Bacteroidales bacterium]